MLLIRYTKALLLLLAFVLISERISLGVTPPMGQTYELHSSAPFHEVRVPIQWDGGNIFVEASFAGKTALCSLDTGAAGIIWPSTLNVPCTLTGKTVQGIDGSGQAVTERLARVSEIKIGDYSLLNVLGKVLETGHARKVADPVQNTPPILGPAAFQHVVVSVDFRKKELVIRDPSYDFMAVPRAAVEAYLNFKMVDSLFGNYGVPCVYGRLGLQRLNLVLDTGWAGSAIGLAEDVIVKSKVLTSHATKMVEAPFLNGATTVTCVENVSLSLEASQPLTIVSDALKVRRVSSLSDGSIGSNVLSRYRITFDFPRKRLLLEGYESTKLKSFRIGGLTVILRLEGEVVANPDGSYMVTYPGRKPISVSPSSAQPDETRFASDHGFISINGSHFALPLGAAIWLESGGGITIQ